MIEKLAEIEKTHEELTARLADPAVLSLPGELRAVTKGRLLQITLAKVDGNVVYRAPEQDSGSDGSEAAGGGPCAAERSRRARRR